MKEGTISVDEAERLISALEKSGSDPHAAVKTRKKYLKIFVDGDDKVDIKIPLKVFHAGIGFLIS